MAMNMDAAIRIAAKVTGQQQLTGLGQSLKGISSSARLTDQQIGQLNRVVKGTAAAAGNSTAALRNHLSALQALRERADIGGKAYNRLGVEIDQLRGKLRALDSEAKRTDVGGMRGALGAAGGALAAGGGLQSAIGAGIGSLAAAGGPKGMAIAATAAAVSTLTDQSVRAALALEAQSRKLRVMSSDGDNLQRSIIALTRDQNYLTSTVEASAAAYEVLQAGFSKTDDILKIVRASSFGAAGGFTDVKIVADATTSILNGYNRSAADAALIVDQMKAVTDDGKISMEAYATSIGRVVPSAAAAKLPLEEINAAIAALTAQGVPVETTFSGINQAIKTILKPTQEAKDLAKELGLDFNASALAAKGFGGFLADVAQKTGKSTDALSILFSDIDGYKAVIGLLNDDLQRFNKFTDNQADALGNAAKAAAIGVDPLKQYSNAWSDFAATLGQVVLPALTEVTRFATILLRSVVQSTERINELNRQGFVYNRMTGDFEVVPGVTKITSPAAKQRPTDFVSRFASARDRAFAAAQKITGRSSRVGQTRRATDESATGTRARSADNAAERAAKTAARLAAANAEKTRTSGIELRNARELYDIEGRILEARLEDNQQLILARNAQKELLSIRQQAAAIMADKELPAAARKNALDKLAVQSGAVSRQLAFDLAELENKRALTAQEAINKLADERELLQAQLMGTEAEIILKQRLRELTKGMTDDEKARVEALVRGNEALRQQKEAAEQMKQLYGDIGMSIKDGVVGAIQGAIDGTKSLQEVASNLLQSIANKLLDVAINMALFGTMSGTGTGGGLLGFLFKKQAKGGAWENGIQAFARGGIVNKPTLLPLAGEAGPEAIMPLKRLPSGRLGVEAAGGGSGGSVNVVVNVDAKGSRVEGDQQQGAALGRAISTAVQAELVKQQRPGGLLAGAR